MHCTLQHYLSLWRLPLLYCQIRAYTPHRTRFIFSISRFSSSSQFLTARVSGFTNLSLTSRLFASARSRAVCIPLIVSISARVCIVTDLGYVSLTRQDAPNECILPSSSIGYTLSSRTVFSLGHGYPRANKLPGTILQSITVSPRLWKTQYTVRDGRA